MGKIRTALAKAGRIKLSRNVYLVSEWVKLEFTVLLFFLKIDFQNLKILLLFCDTKFD